MDLWHTEIKNVSVRIWEKMNWWRCNVGTWKAKSRLNKNEEQVPKTYRQIHCFLCGMCWEKGGGSAERFCLLNVYLHHSYAKLWENEMYRDGYEEAFSPEGSHRVELLTHWGVGINHATAVSSVGACEELKRAVVSGCLRLPAPIAPS